MNESNLELSLHSFQYQYVELVMIIVYRMFGYLDRCECILEVINFVGCHQLAVCEFSQTLTLDVTLNELLTFIVR